MNTIYDTSLFIFRRDLRLADNTALIDALEKSRRVIPCFIFDPVQVTEKNQYRSKHAIEFMIESLKDLSNQLAKKNGKLFIFYGMSEVVIEKLVQEVTIDAIFVNRDYTPFSRNRDENLEKFCRQKSIAFNIHGDYLLHEPEDIYTKSGTPFSVFTAFYNTSLLHQIKTPAKNNHKNYYTGDITLSENNEDIFKKVLPYSLSLTYTSGGTHTAQKILKNLEIFKEYQKTRDFPFIETTHLSAHNKFGTVSIREAYSSIVDNLGINHALLRQLYWRDFFTHVSWHHPRVFGNAFHEKYNDLSWNINQEMFERWCSGTTGFPLVDAGMRQLNQTGFMHNRARLVVGSFLVKDLHINWQWGEKYFAQQLVDYDPCVNNGNWQWVASTGCDSTPYFRIFNPWLQQQKFDPECIYIKTWIPELKQVLPRTIHAWYEKNTGTAYPAPMVDHARQAVITKQLYMQASRKK